MHTNTTEARPACLQTIPTPAKLSSTISFRSRAFCPNRFLWCKLLTLPYLTSSWTVRTPQTPRVCADMLTQTHVSCFSCLQADLQIPGAAAHISDSAVLLIHCPLLYLVSPSSLFPYVLSLFWHPPAVYLERCRMSSRCFSYVLPGVSLAKDLQQGEVGGYLE